MNCIDATSRSQIPYMYELLALLRTNFILRIPKILLTFMICV